MYLFGKMDSAGLVKRFLSSFLVFVLRERIAVMNALVLKFALNIESLGYCASSAHWRIVLFFYAIKFMLPGAVVSPILRILGASCCFSCRF